MSVSPPTPPLSASSSRTHSTASDSSGASFQDPPMSPEDIKIIFNNVTELATFSDEFTVKLEAALGSVLEGGTGEDHVGALFLETVRLRFPI
jgi:dynamin-binding protein